MRTTTAILTAITSVSLQMQWASATVVHTVVNETISTCEQFGEPVSNAIGLDLDADGTDDFTLNTLCGLNEEFEAMMSRRLEATVSGNGMLLDNGTQDLILYATNDPMGNTWPQVNFGEICTEFNSLGVIGTYGNFCGTSGYIGVRFLINGNTHYGWIQVDLSSDFITIVDMAYENVADAPILAGQTSGGAVGIHTAERPSASVFPNPTTGQLTIDLGQAATDALIELRDIRGRLLSTQHSSGQQQLHMLVDGPAGVYLLQVSSAHGNRNVRVLRNRL